MKPVEVRPLKANWVGIGCVALYSLMCFSPLLFCLFIGKVNRGDWLNLIGLTTFGFIPGAAAFVGVLWMVRWCIVVDEQGLRWRTTFRDWQSARWDEITDLYSVSTSERSGKRIEVGEKIVVLEGTNAELAATLVAERAINAPYRVWRMRGARPEETFHHEMKAWSASRWIWAGVGGTIVLWCAIKMLLPTPSVNIWLWQTGPFAFLLLPIGLLMLAVPARRFRQRFERLELSEQGLQLTTRQKEVFVAWDELQAVEKRWRHYVVRFAGGEIEMGGWLPAVAIEYLGRTLAPTARFGSEVTGSSRSVTSEGVCFSRPRGMLFIASFFSLLLISATVGGGLLTLLPADFWAPHPPPRWMDVLSSLCIFFLPVGWVWLTYFRSALIFREAGLEVRGVWRTRFYPWDTLRFWRDENGPHLEANGRTLTLFNVSIRELERELRGRLPERTDAP